MQWRRKVERKGMKVWGKERTVRGRWERGRRGGGKIVVGEWDERIKEEEERKEGKEYEEVRELHTCTEKEDQEEEET